MAVKTPLSARKSTRFDIPFEGKPQFDLSLGVFVFNRAGKLIEQMPVQGTQGQTYLSPKELRHTRMFIAPISPGDKEPKAISLEDMQRKSAYEAVLNFDEEAFFLRPVPNFHWQHWLFKRCRVRGKVQKTVEVNGADVHLPVCNVRVHICEVDNIWAILPRIPDGVILDLRDKLLDLPELQPFPLPIPRPLPDPPRLPITTDVGLNRNPITSRAQLQSVGITSELFSLQQGLRSSQVNQLRHTIGTHFRLLLPQLCLWPSFWPHFYTCDEMRVVQTDSQGRFDTSIWYQCFGDKPDLYFWVEAVIGGTWTTVYRPPIPCNVYWNYVCSSEVTINIQDERVDACGELPTPAGLIARIEKIGSGAYMSKIQQQEITVIKQEKAFRQIGLTDFTNSAGDYRGPFGGTLAPRVYFGSGLRPAGITHYRWRYRKVQEADGTAVTDTDPITIDAPVSIPDYEEENGKAYKKWFRLGPVAGVSEPIFHIPPRLAEDLEQAAFGVDNPNNLTRTWSMQEFATALWNTNQLGNAITSAGLYELSFELLRINGGNVEVVDVPKDAFQIPVATDTNNTMDAPPAYLIPDTSDATRAEGFKVLVRVDNNVCQAEILPAKSNSIAQGDECGFLAYQSGSDPVQLSFKASHPNDFAVFSFTVKKGVNSPFDAANTGGMVIGSTFEESTVDYALTGDTYSKTLNASVMVGSCSNAAFAEVLDVDTLATNGSDRLRGYDRTDTAAFALEKK